MSHSIRNLIILPKERKNKNKNVSSPQRRGTLSEMRIPFRRGRSLRLYYIPSSSPSSEYTTRYTHALAFTCVPITRAWGDRYGRTVSEQEEQQQEVKNEKSGFNPFPTFLYDRLPLRPGTLLL